MNESCWEQGKQFLEIGARGRAAQVQELREGEKNESILPALDTCLCLLDHTNRQIYGAVSGCPFWVICGKWHAQAVLPSLWLWFASFYLLRLPMRRP